MKKPKTKKVKKQKVAYIQKWGTYDVDTLVIVGMTPKEILRYIRRIKVKDFIVKEFEKDIPDLEKNWMVAEKHTGLLWSNDSFVANLLWFPSWKNDWEHWDTLVHELSHAVHAVLGKHKNMMGEDEAKAYQLEFLFREIRRKLWKLLP